jgi:NAD(P)-dependent dehydrogenase (short-subunit alcohol dehydrogenase family)
MSAKKIALVSGANKGIGKEAARQLGLKGFKVYMGSRELARGQEAAADLSKQNIDVEAIQLDVTSQESINQAIKQIEKADGQLDVLVNNAGVLTDRSTSFESTDIDSVEKAMQTNFFGPLRLTKAATHLLKKAKAAKVINVSSSLGSLANMTSNEYSEFRYVGYNCSKAALNMLTIFGANALRNSGIAVNSVCPGYVSTDINDHKGYRTVEQGAGIISKLATSESAQPSGKFFNDAGEIPW